MKKIIFFLFLLTGLAASATPILPIKVDERIQKMFTDAFPNAQDVTWYGDDTHYEVTFFHKDIQCHLTYRLDGTVERTERYYGASDLVPFVLARVTRKYPGYKLHGVTEITTERGLTYYIILEDAQRWVQVQADGTGSLSVMKRFRNNKAYQLKN